jgi:competence protein ComEA
MQKIKSQFVFNKQQRVGILFLVLIIIALLFTYHFIDFSEEKRLDISSTEILKIQKEIDSLKNIETESKRPKIYPFNPNFITDYKAYTLGMSPEEFDRLKLFRSKDKWVNSISDFKNVTNVSDSLLNAISPYFKFPEWVTNQKPKKQYVAKGFSEKTYAQKIDLNKATKEQLQEVSGIGATFSERIINYRNKLGGFTEDIQLYNVWGLDAAVVKRALNLFTVKTPKEIVKMNLNSASASDIATIPGISFDLAKDIWEFRVLREHISDFQELEKIEGLSASKLKLIQLYLSIH